MLEDLPGESSEPSERAAPAVFGARLRWGIGAAIVLFLVALALAVALSALTAPGTVSSESPRDTVGVTSAPTAGHVPDLLHVHVLGAVRRPGLYVLASGSRVIDAVAAAGGFDDEADRGGVNLARSLHDAEQLVVPAVGQSLAPRPGAAPGPGAGKVDLNTADEAALESLPRIGPVTAERILHWRDEHGPFRSVEQLGAVPGIGPKTLESLRERVTV